MKQHKFKIVLILLFGTMSVMAQKPEVFTTEAGAIQGYDPVAFFKEQKPVIGKKKLSYSWNESSWYFSTPENLEAFKADPTHYAPQFGGWCAYGTAAGHKSPTQPETWTIVDDKLYFNYNAEVKKLWNKNQKEMIEKANKNWPTVKKE